MKAHQHAEMIKTKADNMDLVTLRRQHEGDWVEVVDQTEIRIKQNGEYFLCLPQHKEVCLHWLNGGEVQYRIAVGAWTNASVNENNAAWKPDSIVMDDQIEFRIKPRKEKRWIIVDVKTNNTSFAYSNKEVALGDFKRSGSSSQLVEIEVEV